MIYVVTRLRREGKKIIWEHKPTGHVQGHLQLDNGVATLVSEVDGRILMRMEPAEVRKISLDGILVYGREPSTTPGELWPQAWWCTLPEPPAPGRAPLDQAYPGGGRP